jgi:hypothetical protein
MLLGVIVIFGVLVFVVSDAIAAAGKIKVSTSVQKIFLNYLQVAALCSSFPLRWPSELEGLFEFQGAISTLGEHLVNPDCVTKTSTASQLYYSKQTCFAFLPFVLVLCSFLFWREKRQMSERRCFAKRTTAGKTTSKDKFVVTLTSILYLLYPTLCKNAFGLFDCRTVGANSYLSVALEEECFVGTHKTMMWLFGVGQLVLYVLGFPLLVLGFLNHNKEHLDDYVAMSRYGLFYGAYKRERFFWEIVITARKVSIVMLSVFGPSLGPEKQAQVALLILLVCIVLEIYGDPYKIESTRHNVLGHLELAALLVEWWTMWSGLMIYQLKEDAAEAIFLSLAAILANSVLFLWFLVQFVLEKLYERAQEKLEEEKNSAATKKASFGESMKNILAMFRNYGGGEDDVVSDIEMVTVNNPVMPELLPSNPIYDPHFDPSKSRNRSIFKERQKKRSNRGNGAPAPNAASTSERMKRIKRLSGQRLQASKKQEREVDLE